MWTCKSAQYELKRMKTTIRQCKEAISRVYPKTKIHEFMTVDTIMQLGACTCDRRGCMVRTSQMSDSPIFTTSIAHSIHADYRVTFAWLISSKVGCLISKAIEKGLTDEYLAANTLSREEIERLLSLGPDDSEFRVDSVYRRQHKFFMPQFSHRDQKHYEIHKDRALPFHIERCVGKGSFSSVYQARMLEGYHDFNIKDERVAVKLYRDNEYGDEDSENERNVLKIWGTHPFLMSLQASLEHRRLFMLVFPLGKCDLQSFLTSVVPDEHVGNPQKTWHRYMNLLCAIDHIHCSSKSVFGYLCDIKPHNILVRNDDEWAIIDLGLVESKSKDSGTSAIPNRPGNKRYLAPDEYRHRNSDVWSMGAIGCEVLVWLKDGPLGVERFSKDRSSEDNGLDAFYQDFNGEIRLKPSVQRLLDDTKSIKGSLGSKVALVLGEMLSMDHSKRLSARKAAERFAEILGVPMSSLP